MGSLFWIHGKRVYFPLTLVLQFSLGVLFYSGVRKNCTFVRIIPFFPFLPELMVD
jgi:hypothetical protein